MTITREVQSGVEVFAVDDGGGAKDTCDKCALSANTNGSPSLCSNADCDPFTRPDGRGVYFLPQDDLRAQALFHSQEQST